MLKSTNVNVWVNSLHFSEIKKFSSREPELVNSFESRIPDTHTHTHTHTHTLSYSRQVIFFFFAMCKSRSFIFIYVINLTRLKKKKRREAFSCVKVFGNHLFFISNRLFF